LEADDSLRVHGIHALPREIFVGTGDIDAARSDQADDFKKATVGER
jgi:hypothetical protein